MFAIDFPDAAFQTGCIFFLLSMSGLQVSSGAQVFASVFACSCVSGLKLQNFQKSGA